MVVNPLTLTPDATLAEAWKIMEERKISGFPVVEKPNVNGVGIGKKGRKEVIKVFVTHKVPEASLQPQEVVPKKLDGYETDVEEIGVITAQTQ